MSNKLTSIYRRMRAKEVRQPIIYLISTMNGASFLYAIFFLLFVLQEVLYQPHDICHRART